MTESKNVSVKTIAVALVGAGLLAFIGIGLWKAATPAPAPLQGQVDARTIEVAPKIPGRRKCSSRKATRSKPAP